MLIFLYIALFCQDMLSSLKTTVPNPVQAVTSHRDGIETEPMIPMILLIVYIAYITLIKVW